MLLKDFPEGFSLSYSVHVLSLMLQSILIRTEERVDARGFSEEEARAFASLVELLHIASRDAAMLQKRMVN
jgi:hypothetical protein